MKDYGTETIRQLNEASRWLAHLRSDPDSEDSLNNWLQWCDENPQNAEAFERVQRLWRQMDQVADDFTSSTATEPAYSSGFLAANPRLASMIKGIRRNRWRVAAGLVCALCAGAFWHAAQRNMAELPLEVAALQNRIASLPDGSSIHLSAKTSVAIDFGGSERRLRMSSGEAFFKVRPDKKRPFVVHAGTLDVTAVGTAFDVKRDDGSVTVTVQEGVVAVASQKVGSGWTSDSAWRVGPGYQFLYSERDGATSLSSVDTSTVLAWRDGRVEYVNASLASVVADVNRYAQHPIEIADPAVGELTFTGTVFTDAIDGWLQALPGALPVRIQRAPNGTSLILRAAPREH
jgi:transmembrane sensor